jgi:hypothetical protein
MRLHRRPAPSDKPGEAGVARCATLKRAKKPYLVRNKDIVIETASLIAAPADPVEQLRSGTWSTVRFARQRGKPVFLILPDGTVKR